MEKIKEETYNISIWGPKSAGKTVFWAYLYSIPKITKGTVDSDSHPSNVLGLSDFWLRYFSEILPKKSSTQWVVRPLFDNPEILAFLQHQTENLFIKGEFPMPTVNQIKDLSKEMKWSYMFSDAKTGKKYRVNFLDVSGELFDSPKYDDITNIYNILAESDGIIFMIDINSKKEIFRKINGSLLNLNKSKNIRKNDIGDIDIPIIFCLSKSDRLYLSDQKNHYLVSNLFNRFFTYDEFKTNGHEQYLPYGKLTIDEIGRWWNEKKVRFCFSSAVGIIKYKGGIYPNVRRGQNGMMRPIFIPTLKDTIEGDSLIVLPQNLIEPFDEIFKMCERVS